MESLRLLFDPIKRDPIPGELVEQPRVETLLLLTPCTLPFRPRVQCLHPVLNLAQPSLQGGDLLTRLLTAVLPLARDASRPLESSANGSRRPPMKIEPAGQLHATIDPLIILRSRWVALNQQLVPFSWYARAYV